MFRPGPAHSRALSFHNSILRNNRRDARAAARYSQAAHPPALRVGDACQPRLTPLSDAMAAGSRQLVQIRNCMEITIMQLPVLRRSLPVLSGSLLAWRLQELCTPLYLPQPSAEWYFKAAFLTYSGGTAPALHRTSLLCPGGHSR